MRLRNAGSPLGWRVLPVLCLSVGTIAPARAADAPPPPGWYSKDGLSFVMTSGNSSTSTFGAKVELKRLWTKSTFSLFGSAVRSSSADPARRAIGTPTDFQVEDGDKVLKAAKYNVTTMFDHRVGERLAWQVGANFERDTFAGVAGRTIGLAGMSYMWANRKEFTFKTAADLSITHQSEVVNDPTTKDTFVGLRLSAEGERKFGAGGNSSYVGGLFYDQNLQDGADSRLRFPNALSVAMNQRLALQVGLLLVYAHQPSLTEVPLFTIDGLPTGLTVPARAVKLDTTFTVSVVVSFAPPASKP